MESSAKKMLTVALIMLGLCACSSELEKVRGQFIDSCMSGGGSKSNCKCAIDKLQEHYGEKGLLAINAQGYPPADFVDQLGIAANQCRNR